MFDRDYERVILLGRCVISFRLCSGREMCIKVNGWIETEERWLEMFNSYSLFTPKMFLPLAQTREEPNHRRRHNRKKSLRHASIAPNSVDHSVFLLRSIHFYTNYNIRMYLSNLIFTVNELYVSSGNTTSVLLEEKLRSYSCSRSRSLALFLSVSTFDCSFPISFQLQLGWFCVFFFVIWV